MDFQLTTLISFLKPFFKNVIVFYNANMRAALLL